MKEKSRNLKEPVMEEKVRRRQDNHKTHVIYLKRCGHQGGSYLPSLTLLSTMLWRMCSGSSRLTLFSIRQGPPRTSNIVVGGCRG